MPFGLTNAPAVFQAMVNDVLRDFLKIFVFVYLDDILIFAKSESEHVQHVQSVLQRLQENQLFVKAEKCEFHASKVTFLGFIIRAGRILMDPTKVKAVADWPIPTTRKRLQQFLGFANFYRRFIRNYSTVAAPLTALTSQRLTFQWSSAAEEAFSELKTRFSSAPILAFPDPERQFTVEVDASDSVVGAVLSQRAAEDQKMHPCAFFSRKLSSAKQHYDIGNRELLAVNMALEEWRHWLEGAEQPFVAWTDHKNLEYIRSAKRLSSRQARWALFFNRFDFSLSYRPGSKNVKPDALSRQFQSDGGPSVPESILPSKVVIGAITWDIEDKVKQGQADHPAPSACPVDRLFVSANLRSQVLQWGHSSRLACHPGVRRTLALLRQLFWWGSMEEDTKEFDAACQICSQHKSARHAPSGLLQPLPIAHRPWSHISLDFVTGLPPSDGNTTILTVVDRFSKSAHFIPLSKLPSAKETAELMLHHVFRLHGLPSDIVFDRGPQFTSAGGQGQSIPWIPSTIQWPVRKDESRDGNCFEVRGLPQSFFLVQAAPVGGIRLQHASQLSYWTLAFPVLPRLPAPTVSCTGAGSQCPICSDVYTALVSHLVAGPFCALRTGTREGPTDTAPRRLTTLPFRRFGCPLVTSHSGWSQGNWLCSLWDPLLSPRSLTLL